MRVASMVAFIFICAVAAFYHHVASSGALLVAGTSGHWVRASLRLCSATIVRTLDVAKVDATTLGPTFSSCRWW